MRLTIISDTHGEHEKLGILSGDVLIHCGDMFNMFGDGEDHFDRMDDWFGRQNFDLILCVGGNHDFELQKRSSWVSDPFKNAVYLEERSISHRGVTFYGAPWVPELRGQAFYRDREELAECWTKIPHATDVLITHTPPAGILDVSSRGYDLGCDHLERRLREVRPTLHCFGHVHASCGTMESDGTSFVNAALVNSRYELTRGPYYFDLN